MKHRWAALLVVLALSMIMPHTLAAQGSAKPRRDPQTGTTLGQNYPNPFNPETWIPFRIGLAEDGQCIEPSSRQYRVTLRVYNVLAQLVAIPKLQGGDAHVPGGQPLNNVFLTCGEYTAWWDGNFLETGREVASGVYIYRLEVNGRPLIWKSNVQK